MYWSAYPIAFVNRFFNPGGSIGMQLFFKLPHVSDTGPLTNPQANGIYLSIYDQQIIRAVEVPDLDGYFSRRSQPGSRTVRLFRCTASSDRRARRADLRCKEPTGTTTINGAVSAEFQNGSCRASWARRRCCSSQIAGGSPTPAKATTTSPIGSMEGARPDLRNRNDVEVAVRIPGSHHGEG